MFKILNKVDLYFNNDNFTLLIEMVKKAVEISTRAILAVFVLIYLVLSIKANTVAPFLLFILILLSLCIAVYSYHAPHHSGKFKRESFIVSLGIPIGAIVTYILNEEFGLGSILSAGIVGLIASYIPLLYKKSKKLKDIPATFYCGAFIGMTDFSIAKDLRFIMMASLISVVVFLLTKSYFVKIGGRLGTFAFAGVLTTFIIIKIWHLF